MKSSRIRLDGLDFAFGPSGFFARRDWPLLQLSKNGSRSPQCRLASLSEPSATKVTEVTCHELPANGIELDCARSRLDAIGRGAALVKFSGVEFSDLAWRGNIVR